MGARLGRALRLGLLVLLFGPPALILCLRALPAPATPLMLIRLAQGYGLDHRWVDYGRIAPALARAVVASEDNMFCRESLGFDADALAGQFATLLQGERPRGASTITMQTAKNLFLWPGRDPVRKLFEAWLTPQIALLWPKRRVIETYLNIVEFGPGIYGAEAAARRLFGRSAAQLSREQAVRLAVILPNPLHWSADHPGPWVRQRTALIERRMRSLGPLLDCLAAPAG